MAASLKDKRTPITTPPHLHTKYLVLMLLQTPLFSRWSLPFSHIFTLHEFQISYFVWGTVLLILHELHVFLIRFFTSSHEFHISHFLWGPFLLTLRELCWPHFLRHCFLNFLWGVQFLLTFYEFHEPHFFITSLEGSFSSSFFSSRFSRPLLGPPTNWSLQRNAKKDTLNKSQRRQNV